MRDRSIVPTNLLDQPKASSLLPDQRLILLWLWACRYLSCAGTGLLPIKPAAATLGLDSHALDGGINTLVDSGFVARDIETGEIFLLDWFRWHSFKTVVAIRSLESAIKNVQSPALKNAILEKSITYFPTATATSTSTAKTLHAHAKAEPLGSVHTKRKQIVAGVQCWTPEDKELVEKLIAIHGEFAICEASKLLTDVSRIPYPSAVKDILAKGVKNNADNHPNSRTDDPASYYEDLGIELPEREREVAGETITVRA